MSTPIIENIAANVAAAVGQVTVANGYNQDLTAVRPRRVDFSDIVPEDRLVLVMQTDNEPTASQFTGTKQWLQTFELQALVIDSDEAIGSVDTRINQIVSDLRKVMRVDPHRGGYAMDTICGADSRFDDEGFSGAVIEMGVLYRTRVDDPYSQV
ncbi:MAG TPA: hypothetical protein HPP87_04740 [Planctomycetes bacterium]|nr:hypothetical protein [Planctomycetota bacterium]